MTDTAMEGRRTTEEDVPNNLFQNSFRRLYQKTISANAGSRSSSSLSKISEGDGFKFNNDVQGHCAIEMELIDFLNFSSHSEIASTTDHIQINSILFWTKEEQQLRFPFLQRLSLSLLAIPASSVSRNGAFQLPASKQLDEKTGQQGKILRQKFSYPVIKIFLGHSFSEEILPSPNPFRHFAQSQLPHCTFNRTTRYDNENLSNQSNVKSKMQIYFFFLNCHFFSAFV
jgi:hypothetical protein